MADQAHPQSVAERVAAKFMGPIEEEGAPISERPSTEEEALPEEDQAAEAQAEEQSAEGEATEEIAEVELDGVVYEVPAELKDKLMLQADYTRKTQELAEQRKVVSQQIAQQAITQSQVAFEQSLGDLKTQLSQLDLYLSKPVDWNTLTVDQKLSVLADQKQAESLKKAIETEIEGKRRDFSSKQKSAVDKLMAEGLEIVKRTIPNWSEDTQAAIRTHAISDGYTEAEIDSVIDARMVRTLWKAQQYDLLKSKGAKAAKSAKDAPPVVKPSSGRPMPAETRAKLDYAKAIKKAGSVKERNALIQKRVETMF